MRVEICGGIASGKTTLARLLRRARLSLILEDFRRNPFLTDFYKDPRRFAFETELSFVLQHYHAVIRARASRAVCDFSFFLDWAYANFTLTARDRRHFLYLYEILVHRLGNPGALIRLRCPAEIELKRIRLRGRGREKAISVAYLEGLDRALEKVVHSLRGVPVLEIDSHASDFAHNPLHRAQVVTRVRKYLTSIYRFNAEGRG
jgi:deoxyadenosine/deoxycytidine kinase